MIMAPSPSMSAAPPISRFNVAHTGHGLDVETACIETHAFTNQRDRRVVRLAPADVDQTRSLRSGPSDGVDGGKALLDQRVTHDGGGWLQPKWAAIACAAAPSRLWAQILRGQVHKIAGKTDRGGTVNGSAYFRRGRQVQNG